MAGRYTKRVTPEKIAALQGQGYTEREARRILRGHRTTPEHGAASVSIMRDREFFVTNSAQAAMRAINYAARNELRVSIAVYDKHHPKTPLHIWTNPGHKPGIDAKFLRGEMRAAHQNVKQYLHGTAFGATNRHGRNRSPGGVYFPQGITAIQVTVYEWDVRTP